MTDLLKDYHHSRHHNSSSFKSLSTNEFEFKQPSSRNVKLWLDDVTYHFLNLCRDSSLLIDVPYHVKADSQVPFIVQIDAGAIHSLRSYLSENILKAELNLAGRISYPQGYKNKPQITFGSLSKSDTHLVHSHDIIANIFTKPKPMDWCLTGNDIVLELREAHDLLSSGVELGSYSIPKFFFIAKNLTHDKTQLQAFCLYPNIDITLKNIVPMPIIETTLSRYLQKIHTENVEAYEYGVISIDHMRRVLLMVEKDEKAKQLEIFGIWVYGITDIYDISLRKLVYRYIYTRIIAPAIQSLHDSNAVLKLTEIPFLIVAFCSGTHQPIFMECSFQVDSDLFSLLQSDTEVISSTNILKATELTFLNEPICDSSMATALQNTLGIQARDRSFASLNIKDSELILVENGIRNIMGMKSPENESNICARQEFELQTKSHRQQQKNQRSLHSLSTLHAVNTQKSDQRITKVSATWDFTQDTYGRVEQQSESMFPIFNTPTNISYNISNSDTDENSSHDPHDPVESLIRRVDQLLSASDQEESFNVLQNNFIDSLVAKVECLDVNSEDPAHSPLNDSSFSQSSYSRVGRENTAYWESSLTKKCTVNKKPRQLYIPKVEYRNMVDDDTSSNSTMDSGLAQKYLGKENSRRDMTSTTFSSDLSIDSLQYMKRHHLLKQSKPIKQKGTRTGK